MKPLLLGNNEETGEYEIRKGVVGGRESFYIILGTKGYIWGIILEEGEDKTLML